MMNAWSVRWGRFRVEASTNDSVPSGRAIVFARNVSAIFRASSTGRSPPGASSARRSIVPGKLPSLCLMSNGVLVLLTAHSKNHCRIYLSRDGTGRQWSDAYVITSQGGGNTSMACLGSDKLLVFTPANGRICSWPVTVTKNDAPAKGTAASPTNVRVASSGTSSVGSGEEAVLVRRRRGPLPCPGPGSSLDSMTVTLLDSEAQRADDGRRPLRRPLAGHAIGPWS